jgi:hypothetical protein
MGLGEVVSLDRGDGEGKKDRNKEREGEILGVNQHGGCGVSVLLTVMMVRDDKEQGQAQPVRRWTKRTRESISENRPLTTVTGLGLTSYEGGVYKAWGTSTEDRCWIASSGEREEGK